MIIGHKTFITGGIILAVAMMVAVPAQAMTEQARHFLRYHEFPKVAGDTLVQEPDAGKLPPSFARQEPELMASPPQIGLVRQEQNPVHVFEPVPPAVAPAVR